MTKKNINNDNKLFSPWTLLLFAVGLLINLILPKLVALLGLPLFLDNIGSVLTAVLGGAIPGMFVGFLSNIINSALDPITLYYGILTVLIAVIASYFSKKGWLKKVGGCIAASLCFSIVGGAIGSCMTWGLYGGGIGDGISAPYAHMLLDSGFPEFWAQFTADIIIDIPDKLLTILPVFIFLKFYPKKLYNKFTLSYIYDRSDEKIKQHRREEKMFFRSTSLSKHIIAIIVTICIVVSGTTFSIGFIYCQNAVKTKYKELSTSFSYISTNIVDGNKIDEYITKGQNAKGYKSTLNKLQQIYNNFDQISYLYVCKIDENNCCYVFDVDTADEKGFTAGTSFEYDSSLNDYKSDLLSGKGIYSVITNDSYGRLMTSYSPVKDSNGETVAYVCVEMSMDQYMNKILSYIIRMVALLFGITILITTLSIWFIQRRVLNPITNIVRQSREFDSTDPEIWLESDAWKNRIPIETGDELEELYNTICRVEQNVAHNVTDIKESERELRRSRSLKKENVELAQAVKRADEANAAKTAFLSNISHDMRTPLNSVIGFAGLAKDSTDIDEKNNYLKNISESAEYLLGLINDTLDLSRMENGKVLIQPTVVDANQIINNVITLANPSCHAKGVTLTVDTKNLHLSEKTPVLIDSLKVQQIFNNIISNAIKFTPNGGEVKLVGTCLEEDEYCFKDKFSISDNGIGMSKEFLPTIFEPFTQENPYENLNYNGSGLGLSIVKQIVELMGGKIEVESELGKGTTFNVFLNIPKTSTNGLKENDNIPEQKINLNGKKVLVCEDHPLNIKLISLLLEKHGIVATIANNGSEGLDTFKASQEGTFDAILMDIQMPVLNGLEATRQIRKLSRKDAQQIPIIAMTANAYAEDINKGKLAGMNAHITKPLNPQLLYDTLSEQINKYSK